MRLRQLVNAFSVDWTFEHHPGLKQPWARISQRLRRWFAFNRRVRVEAMFALRRCSHSSDVCVEALSLRWALSSRWRWVRVNRWVRVAAIGSPLTRVDEAFGWTLVTLCATIRGTRTIPQALESCW